MTNFLNNFNITDIQHLRAGVYTLQVINNENVIRKPVVKK